MHFTMRVSTLQCPVCVREECPPAGDCSYGEGFDACGCCFRCLNGPDEECEGIWNNAGKCGEGLECVKEFSTEEEYGDDIHMFMFHDQMPGVCKYLKEEEDILRKRRSLSKNRRIGSKLITAKKHKHYAAGSGIPAHVLAQLQEYNKLKGK